ncbi:DNA ligase 1-like [Rhopilema esculentum]|uniref:DNA ligase 1-like n=1 Tax=Rhopilema esculentum TaxID=499914 RepID=UPI0031D827B2|eukprot:gene12672-3382_t
MAGYSRRSNIKCSEVANRQHDCTETESSFFRALEKEDLKRFGGSDDTDRLRVTNKPINGNREDIVKHGTEEYCNGKNELRFEEKRGKVARRNSKAMQSKVKQSRFVQRRLPSFADTKKARGWHSDSELDSMAKGKNLKIKHKRKSREKNSIELSSQKFAERERRDDELELRLGQERGNDNDKRVETILPDSTRDKDAELAEIRSPGDKKKLEESQKRRRVANKKALYKRNLLNCSFPSSEQDDAYEKKLTHEISGENRLMNLLIDYFKDLNKEIMEFRQEKKKTREKVQEIEIKLEKLIAKIEAQEIFMEKQKTKTLNCEGTGINVMDRASIKQEIRSIVGEVHNKYNRQLVEHEVRMKYVQEKAESDMKHLMKCITSNFAQLSASQSMESEKKVDMSINIPAKHMPAATDQSDRVTKFIVSKDVEESMFPDCVLKEACCPRTKGGLNEAKVELPEKDVKLKSPRSEEQRRKYEFYFPKESRDKKEKKSDDAKIEAEPTKEIMLVSNEATKQTTKNSGCLVKDHENESGRVLKVSSHPSGLGTSYIEWKQFWSEKLQRRVTINGNKSNTTEKKDTNSSRNTN